MFVIESDCIACGACADSCPSGAIAMGDGSNDVPMMSISGLSVAYRAKPMVQERAMMTLNFVGLDGLAVVLGA